MTAYFARHERDKAASRWGIDSKGYQAWLLWGGDAGREWATKTLTRQNPSTAYETEKTLRGSSARAPHLKPLKTKLSKSTVCCVKPLKRERKAAQRGFRQTARDLRAEEDSARADASALLDKIDVEKRSIRDDLQTKIRQLQRLRQLNQWAYSNQIRDESFDAIGNSENDDMAEKNIPDHLIELWRENRQEYPYHLSPDIRASLFVEDVESEPETLQVALDELQDWKINNLIEAYQASEQAEYNKALDELEDVPF